MNCSEHTRRYALNGLRALLPALMLVAFLLSPAQASASTVRGKLYRVNPQGQIFAAVGVRATVSRADLGRSGPSYSDPQGMYYLFNIPPGNYVLELWVYPNRPPWAFQIVVPNQPFTDIAPIHVP